MTSAINCRPIKATTPLYISIVLTIGVVHLRVVVVRVGVEFLVVVVLHMVVVAVVAYLQIDVVESPQPLVVDLTFGVMQPVFAWVILHMVMVMVALAQTDDLLDPFHLTVPNKTASAEIIARGVERIPLPSASLDHHHRADRL